MSNTETDDEKFARELQEQFNAEVNAAKKEAQVSSTGLSPEEQLKLDLELAQKLLEEEEGGTSSDPQNKGEPTLVDIQKKQQEEMDILVAMKLQQEMYAQEEFLNKPPPKPQSYAPVPQFMRQKPESNELPPTAEAIKRITSDMKEVLLSKNRDLNVVPDEDDICHVQALIVGPQDTPYANGFFHFDMLYPHDYPWKPPKVQLITTDNGRTRFNPNLYANGKVCLSILGTWSGPGWTQIQTMLSTLLSIQSLMNVAPYHNEPGFEQERKPGDVEKYNQCIRHETIRVAVCGMMENPTCGNLFQEVMEEVFLEKYSEYEATCLKYGPELDGKPMEDPFGEKRGSFKYDSLLKRLKAIKEKLEAKKKDEESKSAMEVEVSSADSSTASNSAEGKEVTSEVQPMETDPQPPIVHHSPLVAHSPVVPNAVPAKMDQAAPSALIESILAAVASAKNASSPAPAPAPANSSTKPADENLELAKQLAEHLAVQSSTFLSADEEYAKMLQDQEYSENNKFGYFPGASPFGGQPKNRQPYVAPTSYAPVKAPSISELMAETESKKDESDGIVCLVCHSSPKEYIILPNCQQPHIYCMACAGKMVKQGPPVNKYNYTRRNPQKRSNAQTIQCVLCSSSSQLDPVGGLTSLRRRKKRKVEDRKTQCPEHNEEYCLFCMDCTELVCYMCAGSNHGRHNVEALDVAQTKLTTNISTQISTLEQKRSKLENFIQSVQADKEKISKASESVQIDVRTKFAELRKLLEEKEKEMEEAVKRMESTKLGNVNSEIVKAQQRIEKIDESVSVAQDAVCEKSTLAFLQKMEDAEEQIRHACMTVDLESKQKWFQLPPVNVQYVEQTLKSMKYKEKANQYGIYDQEEDSFSDEDEY